MKSIKELNRIISRTEVSGILDIPLSYCIWKSPDGSQRVKEYDHRTCGLLLNTFAMEATTNQQVIRTQSYLRAPELEERYQLFVNGLLKEGELDPEDLRFERGAIDITTPSMLVEVKYQTGEDFDEYDGKRFIARWLDVCRLDERYYDLMMVYIYSGDVQIINGEELGKGLSQR